MALTPADLMKITKHAWVRASQADSGAAVNNLGEAIPYNKVRYVFMVEVENYNVGLGELHVYLGDAASVKRKAIDRIQCAGDGAMIVWFDNILAPSWVLRPYVQDTKATPTTAHQLTQLAVTYEDVSPAGAANKMKIKISYYDLPTR